MRPFALPLLVLLGLAACGGPAKEEKQLSSYATHEWSLISAYERAHKEKKVEHALALVHLGSVDYTTRDVLIQKLTEDFQKELVSAKYLPLTGSEQLEYVINDRHYVPNLKVEKRLHLEFRARGADGKPAASTTEYYVGTLEGREMIASSHATD